MMSGPADDPDLDSASGLPRSIVITVAMASVRFAQAAAARITLARSTAGVFSRLQTLAAAASASSKIGDAGLMATVPMVLPSAGCTGGVRLPRAGAPFV